MLENIPTKACEIAVACSALPQSAGGIKTKTELGRPRHITSGKPPHSRTECQKQVWKNHIRIADM